MILALLSMLVIPTGIQGTYLEGVHQQIHQYNDALEIDPNLCAALDEMGSDIVQGRPPRLAAVAAGLPRDQEVLWFTSSSDPTPEVIAERFNQLKYLRDIEPSYYGVGKARFGGSGDYIIFMSMSPLTSSNAP